MSRSSSKRFGWFWAGGRFPAKDLFPYIAAQVLGGIVAGGFLYLMASGKQGFEVGPAVGTSGHMRDLPAHLDKLLKSLMTATQYGFTSIFPGTPGPTGVRGRWQGQR